MQQTPLEKILSAVEHAKAFPNPIIEYNFSELPRHNEIKPTSFFGIKAIASENAPKESAKVIYKFS